MSPVSDAQAAAYLRAHPGFEQASISDPTEATAQTVRYMARLVKHSCSDPILFNAWQDAWNRFHVLAGDDPAKVAWWYAKYSVRFVHHQEMLVDWLGLPDELQLLISPEALLKMREPKGDCAVFTTLICALLSIAEVPWEIKTVAVNPMYPGIFSHVYARAVRKDGRRIALDASHGKFPGWEAPRERVSAAKVWNESGQEVSDQDSGYRGLHGVNMSGMGCACGGKCGQSFFGMGQDDEGDEDPIIIDTTPYLTPPTTFTTPDAGTASTLGTPTVATPAAAASSSSSPFNSPAFDAALANLGAAWTKIAGNVIAPQTTITTPQGLQVTTPAGQTSALSTILGGASLSSSSLMPLLLIGGLAIGGLMLISSATKH
jgi:hypothetical protein